MCGMKGRELAWRMASCVERSRSNFAATRMIRICRPSSSSVQYLTLEAVQHLTLEAGRFTQFKDTTTLTSGVPGARELFPIEIVLRVNPIVAGNIRKKFI